MVMHFQLGPVISAQLKSLFQYMEDWRNNVFLSIFGSVYLCSVLSNNVDFLLLTCCRSLHHYLRLLAKNVYQNLSKLSRDVRNAVTNKVKTAELSMYHYIPIW